MTGYPNNPAYFSGLKRLLATNSTATAASITNATEYLVGVTYDPNRLVSVDRGLILFPFGTDAADETATIDIYAAFPMFSRGSILGPVAWMFDKIDTLVCTLGTKTGTAAGVVLDTELYADTIAATNDGPLSNLTGLYSGGTQVYSPADNTRAFWAISDAGVTHLYIDPWKNSQTAATINCLIGTLGG